MATRAPQPRKGVWFPLSLAALVLLALPAAVLLALSLLGMEGRANGWLQRALGLSYRNPLPAWASVLLLLVPVALALLYFLKLRRKALLVPSTFLWRKSIEDLRVNSLFQWLRDNLLLLLQLAVVLLLIYSALGFQIHGDASAGGKNYILLIDSSASMAATDVSPSRLEAARAAALREIDGRPQGDAGMVVEFNSRAATLQPYTRDKGLLRAAVRRIAQTARPTCLDEALALADGLANPPDSAANRSMRPVGEDPSKRREYVAPEGMAAEIHLYSDGRFPDVPGFGAGNLALRYHRIGAEAQAGVRNVGIVDMNAVRDEKDPSRLKVFLRVLNYSPQRAEPVLELEWSVAGQDGFSLRDQALSLPGRTAEGPGEQGATFVLEEIDEGSDVVLHARLTKGKEPWRDQLALDDQAWLVAGVARKARVLIVTPGNAILSDFFGLEETAKVAAVSYLAPADLASEARYRGPARSGAFDLVVFDRCAPAADAMPAANTFFIDEAPPPWKRAAMPPLKRAAIKNPASGHRLMRHLSGLDEIAFDGGFAFDLEAEGVPARVPRLLEGEGGTALLFVLPRRSWQDVVLAFPLVGEGGAWMTNWNLKLSFPLFLRNLLYDLGNVSDSSTEEVLRAGEVKALFPEGGAEAVEVRDPARKTRRLTRSASGEFAFHGTERPGVYLVTWPGGSRAFAVNLLDEAESDIAPRDAIKVGDQEVEAGQARPQVHDTWKWIALAALGLLLVEWMASHRRA